MKLPKNFRQIGEVAGATKIYIEDYVMTYLDYLTKDSGTYVRGAILFGEIEKESNQTYVFVTGAMEAQNIELDLDETVFDNEIWKRIYEIKEQYFSKSRVIGWYLCRMGMSVRLNDRIKRTHFENFPGEGKILYIRDPLEENDAMYVFRSQDLVRQTGYYIYYSKNYEMQEYLIQKKQEKKSLEHTYEQRAVKQRDRQIVQQSRKKMKKKKRKRKAMIRKMAAAAVGMFVLGASGTYFIMGRNIEIEQVAKMISKPVEKVTTESIVLTGEKTTTEETDVEKAVETTYIVQKGDTLIKISQQQMGSKNYVGELMEINEIGEGDAIYPGQKLKIPPIR